MHGDAREQFHAAARRPDMGIIDFGAVAPCLTASIELGMTTDSPREELRPP